MVPRAQLDLNCVKQNEYALLRISFCLLHSERPHAERLALLWHLSYHQQCSRTEPPEGSNTEWLRLTSLYIGQCIERLTSFVLLCNVPDAIVRNSCYPTRHTWNFHLSSLHFLPKATTIYRPISSPEVWRVLPCLSGHQTWQSDCILRPKSSCMFSVQLFIASTKII